jgi:hypothetical protein
MSNIAKVIYWLTRGSSEEARRAAKFLGGIKRDEVRARDWVPFFSAMANFAELPSMEHQAAFLLALKHPIAAVGNKEFERFSRFLLSVLEHPSGKLRQAALVAMRELINALDLAQFVASKKKSSSREERRIRRDRKRFMIFLDALEGLRDASCGRKLEKFQYIEELPPSVCKSAETAVFDIMEDPTCEYIVSAYKKGELDKLPLTSPDSIYEIEVGKDAGFSMPAWMDCTWRRLPCGKADCPICGRIEKHRAKHAEHGDDSQTIDGVLGELRNSLQDILGNLGKHLKQKGIAAGVPKLKNPPKPEHFPLVMEISRWADKIYNLGDLAREEGALWVDMEAAADVFWYANILRVKVYKQLCNHWYIKHGINYGAFDYDYTKSAISQIFAILNPALAELGLLGVAEKGELMLAAAELARLQTKIASI